MNNVCNLQKEIAKCTSCQVCSAVCPFDAISISLDAEGFYRPFIDESKCTECGKCKKVCYKYDDIVMSDEHIKTYACRSRDDSILSTVTSGGVAYMLANTAIGQGYKVAGVVYDCDKDIAETKVTDCNIEDFKGSKYIQAYTMPAFKEIISNCDGNKYMVFGTPCQIYALDKAVKLAGKRENFVFVDLFCHGCPSMLLWQKYIAKAKKILGAEKFEKVEFRSKKRGWHEYCLYFEANGKKRLTKNGFDDFYRLFFSDAVLNGACIDCKLRSTLNYTDIRLGDFWGYRYDNNTKGISAAVAVSNIGQEWISRLPEDVFIDEHKLEEVTRWQSYGLVYNINTRIRERLFELLKSEANIDAVVSAYNSALSPKLKAKTVIKKIFCLFPRSIRYSIKKCIHSK